VPFWPGKNLFTASQHSKPQKEDLTMKKTCLFAAAVLFSFLIQRGESAVILDLSGWSEPVGVWDPMTKTGVLTEDVTGAILIDAEGITLDGGGHVVSGGEWRNRIGVYAHTKAGLTIRNLRVEGCGYGIWLVSCTACVLEGNSVCSNGYAGIMMSLTDGITLVNNTTSLNSGFGILIELTDSYSSHTLTGNTAEGNGYDGMNVQTGVATLTDNIASNNGGSGIYVHADRGATLTGTTANWDGYTGMCVYSSDALLMRNNSMSGNRYNFDGWGSPALTDVDTSNTVDGRPIYWVIGASGATFDSATNAGVFYAACCNGITIKDLNLTKNGDGILLFDTHNARIENVRVSDCVYGISLCSSNDNVVIGCSANGNEYGIWLNSSCNNQIYNNNFLHNATQGYDVYSSGNVFNLAKEEGGGNYWSDWTGPDADGDGFVDSPYVFYGGQDNFPLADNDVDGVPDGVENAAPNNGDGNSDGIPDSQQDNVASLPNAEDGEYVTLVSPEGTQLADVIAFGNPSPSDAPPGVDFPIGFLSFKVQGLAPGGSVDVTLFLPANETIASYYKYGPTRNNPEDHWYEFIFEGETGAEVLPDRVILHFIDGEEGDDDVVVNGEVVEPGAPAFARYTRLAFLPPLGPDNKRLFKQGSTIPVKFRLADANGNPVPDALATLAVYYLEDGAPDGQADVVSTAAGDWGDQFRYSPEDDLYIFNLSTKHPSYYNWFTYRLEVTLDDGQTGEVDFSLK
jgi:parallel beta-helix repeat protein